MFSSLNDEIRKQQAAGPLSITARLLLYSGVIPVHLFPGQETGLPNDQTDRRSPGPACARQLWRLYCRPDPVSPEQLAALNNHLDRVEERRDDTDWIVNSRSTLDAT